MNRLPHALPLALSALFAQALPACVSTPGMRDDRSAQAAEGVPWSAPSIEQAVSVRDGHARSRVAYDAWLDRLAEADVVFLGETHLDETTHRLELAVYEELLARRSGRVVLALEMFERDVQPELDDYLAGRIDEAAFLEVARPWTQYATAYRPLIERARREGLPVVASNFPRPLLRRMAMEGREVLGSPELAGQTPAELHPNTPEYRRRTDNAVRGHINMMPRNDDDPERVYSTQTLWDNAMGEACALALDAHPGWLVLHVNGSFHSSYWDGTVRQLAQRKPGAKVATVAIHPTANPSTARMRGAPIADWVVFAEARATDLDSGTYSVHVRRELDYRLHLPEGASADAPVPLLIWLSDDGFVARDGLSLWKQRLGAEAAIVVLEAPWRETQEDLVEGGRWFWPDTFMADVGLVTTALERVWAYVLRNQPIDPDRVCIAGEGTGATSVVAATLLDDRIQAEFVALLPRRYAKLKDLPLPLPIDRGDELLPERSLHLELEERDEPWWNTELAEYAAVELDAAAARVSSDPWSQANEAENALRAGLGLTLAGRPAGRRYVQPELESPRAHAWARLEALRLGAELGQSVAVLDAEADPGADAGEALSLTIHPSDFLTERSLPRSPGAFGGTTVIALPGGLPDAELAAWRELQEADPLAKASRFHRVRLATDAGNGGLVMVLEELRERGRNNVLIVPGSFCVDGTTMGVLRREIGDLADRMNIAWRPGLGGLDPKD